MLLYCPSLEQRIDQARRATFQACADSRTASSRSASAFHASRARRLANDLADLEAQFEESRFELDFPSLEG